MRGERERVEDEERERVRDREMVRDQSVRGMEENETRVGSCWLREA